MDAVTMFVACTLTLAPPQSGSPCRSAPDPLHVTALPVVAHTASDIPPGLGGHLAPRAASLIDHWEPYIAEAAQRFAIPQDWIRAVMHSESGGRTTLNGQPITSIAGAMGLMQLMPGTYSDMRSRYGLGTDSYDPHDNVLAGAAYLRLMYQQYGYPSLFAAYNAGPARFDGYLLRGRALPSETLAYVGGIVPGVELTMARRGSAYQIATPNAVVPISNNHRAAPNQGLFFALNQPSNVQLLPANRELESENSATQTGGLFIPLSRPTP
jgi:SLT domain-containing protein